MLTVTPAPSVLPQPSGPPRSTVLVVLSLLWAVALLPIGGFLAIATVLGLTPTSCAEPAPFLCGQQWVFYLIVLVVLAGWLLAMGLALSAARGHRGTDLGFSVAALLGTVLVLFVVGSLVAG